MPCGRRIVGWVEIGGAVSSERVPPSPQVVDEEGTTLERAPPPPVEVMPPPPPLPPAGLQSQGWSKAGACSGAAVGRSFVGGGRGRSGSASR